MIQKFNLKPLYGKTWFVVLTLLKNGCKKNYLHVRIPASKAAFDILSYLLHKGLINYFSKRAGYYIIVPAYDNSFKPVIKGVSGFSKAPRYLGVNEINNILTLNRLLIIRTRFGFLLGEEACKLNLGGLLVCAIET